MLEVTRAEPRNGCELRIGFSDGRVGGLDCSFLFASGLGAELRDPSYFRQVSIDPELRTVVWPNGLDPAPELLYRRSFAGASARGVGRALGHRGSA